MAFASAASNLVSGDTNGRQDIFLYDTATGRTTNITLGGDSSSGAPSVSPDGSTVAFQSQASDLVSGDTNGRTDIFLYDLA